MARTALSMFLDALLAHNPPPDLIAAMTSLSPADIPEAVLGVPAAVPYLPVFLKKMSPRVGNSLDRVAVSTLIQEGIWTGEEGFTFLREHRPTLLAQLRPDSGALWEQLVKSGLPAPDWRQADALLVARVGRTDLEAAFAAVGPQAGEQGMIPLLAGAQAIWVQDAGDPLLTAALNSPDLRVRLWMTAAAPSADAFKIALSALGRLWHTATDEVRRWAWEVLPSIAFDLRVDTRTGEGMDDLPSELLAMVVEHHGPTSEQFDRILRDVILPALTIADGGPERRWKMLAQVVGEYTGWTRAQVAAVAEAEVNFRADLSGAASTLEEMLPTAAGLAVSDLDAWPEWGTAVLDEAAGDAPNRWADVFALMGADATVSLADLVARIGAVRL